MNVGDRRRELGGVVVHAGAGRQHPRHEGRSSGGAQRARRVGVLEYDAGLGETVDRRRLRDVVAVGTEVRGGELVDDEEEDVRAASSRPSARRYLVDRVPRGSWPSRTCRTDSTARSTASFAARSLYQPACGLTTRRGAVGAGASGSRGLDVEHVEGDTAECPRLRERREVRSCRRAPRARHSRRRRSAGSKASCSAPMRPRVFGVRGACIDSASERSQQIVERTPVARLTASDVVVGNERVVGRHLHARAQRPRAARARPMRPKPMIPRRTSAMRRSSPAAS